MKENMAEKVEIMMSKLCDFSVEKSKIETKAEQ